MCPMCYLSISNFYFSTTALRNLEFTLQKYYGIKHIFTGDGRSTREGNVSTCVRDSVYGERSGCSLSRSG